MSSDAGSLSTPKVDVFIDMGNPVLNRTVDGFLKTASVAATRAAVEETFRSLQRGHISSENLEHAVKRICKEGAHWGTVGGVYLGVDYGIASIRGTRDWKNAMLSGATAGALVSAASNSKGEKIIIDAITGGAIATAAEFLSYLT